MFVKKRRVDICDPIHTEREIRMINNPRRMIFLSDIFTYAGIAALGFALLWVAIYAVCGSVMLMDILFGGVFG